MANGKKERFVRIAEARTNKIIDMISNYTTLSELKANVVKKKTLNRFIVR